MGSLETTRQRLPVRLFNGSQRWLARLGRRVPAFAGAEQELLDAARRTTGLDDFGDGGFREGLRALLVAYDQEARLSPFGRWMVRQELAGILRNRLRAEHAWRDDPSLRAAPVRRPLFILGLPRTGTTALHHLLARDPANQVLEYWLAAAPGPRPPREAWAGDPRYRQAARGLRLTYFLDPGLKAIHLMTPDGPEECRHLLGQSLTDDTFECNADIPSYSRWYAGADMRPAYARHRALLGLLQSSGPRARWVLKYPAHLRHLSALLEVYPDACFLWPHRDPLRVLPSLCSLIAGWRGIYEERVDPRQIGAWQLELWSRTLRHAVQLRAGLDRGRFFDVYFDEVLADPVAVLRRAYAHFGFDWSAAAERALGDWHAAHPQGRHGEHLYAPERFGLEPGLVAERFSAYTEHFRIAPERQV